MLGAFAFFTSIRHNHDPVHFMEHSPAPRLFYFSDKESESEKKNEQLAQAPMAEQRFRSNQIINWVPFRRIVMLASHGPGSMGT